MRIRDWLAVIAFMAGVIVAYNLILCGVWVWAQ